MLSFGKRAASPSRDATAVSEKGAALCLPFPLFIVVFLPSSSASPPPPPPPSSRPWDFSKCTHACPSLPVLSHAGLSQRGRRYPGLLTTIRSILRLGNGIGMLIVISLIRRMKSSPRRFGCTDLVNPRSAGAVSENSLSIFAEIGLPVYEADGRATRGKARPASRFERATICKRNILRCLAHYVCTRLHLTLVACTMQ